MSFDLDISKFIKKTKKHQRQIITGVAFELSYSIIVGTPVDTGRARGAWQPSINYKPTAQMLRLDKTGSKVGREISTVSIKAPGNIFYLTNNLPYINRLEFEGWSKRQAPNGMVRINVQRFQSIINKKVALYS